MRGRSEDTVTVAFAPRARFTAVMDPVALVFYAIVCACLGLAGPRLGAPLARLGIGAAVGIVAAAVLPALRGMIGL